jgi:hypothetical protein
VYKDPNEIVGTRRIEAVRMMGSMVVSQPVNALITVYVERGLNEGPRPLTSSLSTPLPFGVRFEMKELWDFSHCKHE